ncbi:elongation factor 1-beta, partial [Candidatus Woesearchaeota archaeon]|nr:elongation factor 1-beta [Candidatus Woesearchaeota archaeon]
MAQVIITLRIMPDSTDTDLAAVEKKAAAEIERLGSRVGKKEITPIAFGLNALV